MANIMMEILQIHLDLQAAPRHLPARAAVHHLIRAPAAVPPLLAHPLTPAQARLLPVLPLIRARAHPVLQILARAHLVLLQTLARPRPVLPQTLAQARPPPPHPLQALAHHPRPVRAHPLILAPAPQAIMGIPAKPLRVLMASTMTGILQTPLAHPLPPPVRAHPAAVHRLLPAPPRPLAAARKSSSLPS